MRYLVIFFTFCMIFQSFSQSEELIQLKDSVENLNKHNYFTLSKNILKKYIATEAKTATNKFYAQIYYAEIFKYTDDYVNVNLHLNKAKEYAELSKEKKRCLAVLNYHKTLVAFDTRNYKKAENLFNDLQPNFLLLQSEEQAMLLIVKAYLSYNENNYNEAINFYKLAERKLISSQKQHNLPLIYQKLMSVYAQIDDSLNYTKSFKQSLNYADKYHIKKYRDITLLVLNDMIANDNHFAKMSSTNKKAFHAKLLAHYNGKTNTDIKEQNFSYLLYFLVLILVIGALLFLIVKKRKHTTNKNTLPETTSLELTNEKLLNQLTEKQKEVVLLVAKGKSNAEIAEDLNISVSTVKYHISNIYSILNISRRTELVNLINK